MKLEHGFTVPVPVEQAWNVLLDLETVAPCMPGAALTSHEGDDFTGTVKVKLGPVNMTYKGQGRIVEKNEADRTAVIEASGKESRGAGTAKARVTANLRPDSDGATRVDVVTDLNITGRPAQFGRGMLADVGGKLIGQFAECLSRKIQEGEVPAAGAEAVPSEAAPTEAAEAPGTAPAVGQPAATGAGAVTPAAPGAGAAPEPTTAAAPGAGAAPGPAAAPGGVVAAAPTATATAPVTAAGRRGEAEVEPIDLLKVTGAGSMAKRAGTYLAVFAAGVLLGWLISRFTGN